MGYQSLCLHGFVDVCQIYCVIISSVRFFSVTFEEVLVEIIQLLGQSMLPGHCLGAAEVPERKEYPADDIKGSIQDLFVELSIVSPAIIAVPKNGVDLVGVLLREWPHLTEVLGTHTMNAEGLRVDPNFGPELLVVDHLFFVEIIDLGNANRDSFCRVSCIDVLPADVGLDVDEVGGLPLCGQRPAQTILRLLSLLDISFGQGDILLEVQLGG